MNAAPAWLAELRSAVQDGMNAHDYQAVWEMREQLRQDIALWNMWAVAVAIAGRCLGHAQAREVLEEAISAGFSQPEMFEPRLSDAFGDDADWPRLRKRMLANIPPAPVTLRRWPRRVHGPRVGLFRLDTAAEARLRQRLPEPKTTAWGTAVELLRWTAQRWRHANDHVDKPDALDILDKVDAGQRFACVEYATVLTQALNAVSIPARRVRMFSADYHHGLGKGHVTTEAWIDEFGAWVLLDPQNGMYWLDDDGTPASTLDLHRRFQDGRPRPAHTCVSTTSVDADDAEVWWRHFRHLSVTGSVAVSWGEQFVPVLQNDFALPVDVLGDDAAAFYPDLNTMDTAVADDDGAPALRFAPAHPYAVGVAIASGGAGESLGLHEHWLLSAREPGEHLLTVATRTPYATLAAQPLEFSSVT